MTRLLEPNVARLHVLRLELLNKGHFDSYRELANDEEIARAKAFVFDKHREEFLATRGLVRTVLGSYAGADPKKLRFTKGEWGKPSIAGPDHAKEFSFNLSNTDGMVVLMVTRERDVGVDVERVDRTSDLDSVAARVFSASELAALKRLAPEEQRERFFAYWTLKESYIKARGMGLQLPLEKFSFDVDTDPSIEIAFDRPIIDDPKVWQFGRVSLSPTHRAAWAIQRGTNLSDLAVEIVDTVP